MADQFVALLRDIKEVFELVAFVEQLANIEHTDVDPAQRLEDIKEAIRVWRNTDMVAR